MADTVYPSIAHVRRREESCPPLCTIGEDKPTRWTLLILDSTDV